MKTRFLSLAVVLGSLALLTNSCTRLEKSAPPVPNTPPEDREALLPPDPVESPIRPTQNETSVFWTSVPSPVKAEPGQGVLASIIQPQRNGYDPSLLQDLLCMVGEVRARTPQNPRAIRRVYGPSHRPGVDENSRRLAQLLAMRELDAWGFLPPETAEIPTNSPPELAAFAADVMDYDASLSISYTTSIIAKSFTRLVLEKPKRSDDSTLRCGEAYISAVGFGAALQITLRAEFPTPESRAQFENEFGFSAPFGYGWTDTTAFAERLRDLKAHLSLRVGGVTGTPDVFAGLASAAHCSAEDLQGCLSARAAIESEFMTSLETTPSWTEASGWVPVRIQTARYPNP